KQIVNTFIDSSVDTNGNIITNERHAGAIRDAIASLKSAKSSYSSLPTECSLIDLRNAYFALGAITGNTASEDIIDNIFSKFCLGK
ncbi:MAG: tRNA uridine-5-carboxymethylaminomethyl(34) synthesis GTPase MnmE, partial [Clostridia bacterium]|nr:tRNA uridine-5-carboxymethylaminomethyl(34) synthesis GTPase MnmE [Clostridia bacterium]